jgi:hypothetical protein
MLKRRHLVINSGFNCLMSANPPEETLEHLLFHCPFSNQCWASLNMQWQVFGTRLYIVEQGRRDWSGPLFMEVMLTGSWNIWKEHNAYLFQGVAPSLDSWKSRFMKDFELLVHRTKSCYHSFIFNIVSRL